MQLPYLNSELAMSLPNMLRTEELLELKELNLEIIVLWDSSR
jgi:hypothetical protein